MPNQYWYQSPSRLHQGLTSGNLHKNRKEVQVQEQRNHLPASALQQRCDQDASVLLHRATEVTIRNRSHEKASERVGPSTD